MTTAAVERPEIRRDIVVRQKPVYTMTAMLSILLVAAVLLTALWIFGPPIDRLSGRQAGKVKLLMYMLPVIWVVVIWGGIFFGKAFRKFPRSIQVRGPQMTFLYRDGSQRTCDATKITEITRDKYANVHVHASAPDEKFSVPTSALRPADKAWFSEFVSLVCSFHESQGRPVRMG